jgi:hypothetical protein
MKYKKHLSLIILVFSLSPLLYRLFDILGTRFYYVLPVINWHLIMVNLVPSLLQISEVPGNALPNFIYLPIHYFFKLILPVGLVMISVKCYLKSREKLTKRNYLTFLGVLLGIYLLLLLGSRARLMALTAKRERQEGEFETQLKTSLETLFRVEYLGKEDIPQSTTYKHLFKVAVKTKEFGPEFEGEYRITLKVSSDDQPEYTKAITRHLSITGGTLKMDSVCCQGDALEILRPAATPRSDGVTFSIQADPNSPPEPKKVLVELTPYRPNNPESTWSDESITLSEIELVN